MASAADRTVVRARRHRPNVIQWLTSFGGLERVPQVSGLVSIPAHEPNRAAAASPVTARRGAQWAPSEVEDRQGGGAMRRSAIVSGLAAAIVLVGLAVAPS